MMRAHLLAVLPLLVAIDAAYPSSYYGGNRYGYGGGTARRSALQWASYGPVFRAQRTPMNYYTVYPYSQSYLDDYYRYYPQETLYYPRSAKYDFYLPSYYQKIPGDGYDGYYYDVDPAADLQEDVLQEVEREEREESQPIGHEKLYETEDYGNFDNYDRASVAYFQNLLAQRNRQQQNSYDYDAFENEWQDVPATKIPNYRDDKDVQDLRTLKTKSRPGKSNQQYFQKNDYKRSNNVPSDHITSSVPKTQLKPNNKQPEIRIKIPSTTTNQPASLQPRKDVRGQKEEVMMRPATPVKNPFSAPLMNMMVKNDERKRSPSVFDTLKRMLEMEKSLKNKYGEENLKPAMKKRIISDEDSLARQLTVLKKSY